jgi:HK97 gp10 family phage protein
MIMATIVKVEGLSDLLEALQELPKATQSNVVRRVLLAAGEPIERAAEALAPHMTGALERSIETGTKLSKRQRALHKKESKIEIFVGAGALVQAITQEFGTAEHGAQPFMRPAWASTKMRALEIVKNQLGEEIMKAAQRAARKAARLAAKINSG